MPKTNFKPKVPPFQIFKRTEPWRLQEFRKHILMRGYSKQANRVGQGKIFLFIRWYEEKYKTDFDVSCLTQKLIRVYKKHLAGYSNMEKTIRCHYLSIYLLFLYRNRYIDPHKYFHHM